MEFLRKNKILIISIIVLLILLVTARAVYAYLTNYIRGTGNIVLQLDNPKIEITESSQGNSKGISIKNVSGSNEYVRVKVVTPQTVTANSSSTNWTLKNDGYYYYNSVIENGQSSNILFSFSTTKTDNYKTAIIVEETIEKYNEDGTGYADWNSTIVESE